MNNINTEYEILTKDIYETLLKEDGVSVDVRHNVVVQGKALQHQIDVYWEYKVAGVLHKVAIECKNYNSNVSIAKVRDFYGVLSDIGNINGIMVSKMGFQSGAKDFAEYYGINLMELREPTEKDWTGRLKSINVDLGIITLNIKDRKFNLDEDWIRNNIDLSSKDEFRFSLNGRTDQIYIYKLNGEKIINLFDMENKLPQNWKTEEDLKYEWVFEDGYLHANDYGYVKIKSIDFVYNVNSGESQPIFIDGNQYAKAILKNALSNEIKFFNHDGSIK